MKTEHVQAIVRFIRRVQPADLILPAGAALISHGLQRLVDREDRQRARLAALAELVDDHRQTLEANGVELPAEVFGDEAHPLDIELALQTVLARTPAEPDNGITDNANPVKRPRFRRALTILGLAGAAGVTVWARGYARTYGQEPTLTGFLSAWRGPVAGHSATAPNGEPCDCAVHTSFPDITIEVCHFDDCGQPIRWIRRHQVWGHFDPETGAALAFGHFGVPLAPEVNEEAGPLSPTAERAMEAGWAAAARGDEDVIGRGVPPVAECGWPGCDWSSDATRSEQGQLIQAALHRNKCLHRPAGAQVAG